ncbi:MAG: DUF5916 domain-containing protein, partial [Bacteroidota bacterium]
DSVNQRIETSPLTNYNILVLDQALNGRSSITFTNTNVVRQGNSRNANVSSLDVALYDKRNIYALLASGKYSTVYGNEKYDGFNTSLRLAKVSGIWQYFLLNNLLSDKYDPNDLGYLDAPNLITSRGNLSYNYFTPTKSFLTYNYSLEARTVYLYKPYSFSRFDVTAKASWVFKNFWDLILLANVIPIDEHNYFELRTAGRYLSYPLNYIIEATGNTDSRKKAYVSYDLIWAHAPQYSNTFYSADITLQYRFSNKLTLSLEGIRNEEKNQLGYAFIRETNNEPIVGFRDNTTVTSILSGIYNFTPRINLTLRARHYWNKVIYKDFFDVDNNGKLVARDFLVGKNDNVNIF